MDLRQATGEHQQLRTALELQAVEHLVLTDVASVACGFLDGGDVRGSSLVERVVEIPEWGEGMVANTHFSGGPLCSCGDSVAL
jgi:hypothetical protein